MRTVIIIFTVLIASICSADIINVPSSIATTIQAGINAANGGDTVLVSNGTYTGPGNRDLNLNGQEVVVMSVSGPELTIIDCQGTESEPHRAFIFDSNEDTTAIVEGFTMMNGYALSDFGSPRGGAVFCYQSTPNFKNCIFRDNFCHGRGGAVAVYASSPKFIDCSFIDNSAFHGGAVYLSAGTFKNDTRNHEPMLINCTFSGNEALTDDSYGGGICARIWNLDVIVDGCVFYDNTARYGGGISVGQNTNLYISNCTFVYNTAENGASIDVYDAGTSEVLNSIISYSLSSEAIYMSPGANVIINCCNQFGNFGGDWSGSMMAYLNHYGNIAEDPLFCDTASGDFTIHAISPCSPFMNPECQLIGALNVGCYGETEFPIAASLNFGSTPFDSIVFQPVPNIFWSYIDTAVTIQAQYEIEVGTDDDWTVAEMWSSGQISSSDTSVSYSGLPLTRGETYYVRVRVNNGSVWGSWMENWFMLNPDFVVHVPVDASTIQEGIDLTQSGDTVLVAPGTYTGNGNRDLDYGGRNIVVISEQGPDVTIIDCGGSQSEPHRAFNFVTGENSSAILKGFTITGGYGTFMDGYYTGGAVYLNNTSPSIIECIFDQNDAEIGGAVYSENANPTINDCLFNTNTATIQGGAIASENDTPTFDKCEFYDNDGGAKGGAVAGYESVADLNGCIFANNTALDGGALHYEGYSGKRITNVTMEFCQLYDNIAQTNGGAAYFGLNTPSSLLNCTISDNQAAVASGIYTQSSDLLVMENCIIAFGINGEAVFCDEPGIPTVTCCDIYGNVGGDWIGCISGLAGSDGNFSDDPIFCDRTNDYYRLRFSNSPCLSWNNDCDVLIGALDYGCGDYMCGDANSDMSVNVSDAVYIIGYVFVSGSPAPSPYLAGDVNCDYNVNVTDAVWIINYVFISGSNAPCDSEPTNPNGDGIPDC